MFIIQLKWQKAQKCDLKKQWESKKKQQMNKQKETQRKQTVGYQNGEALEDGWNRWKGVKGTNLKPKISHGDVQAKRIYIVNNIVITSYENRWSYCGDHIITYKNFKSLWCTAETNRICMLCQLYFNKKWQVFLKSNGYLYLSIFNDNMF